MAEIMDRSRALKIFTCIIERLTEEFDKLEKVEDMRRVGNSIGALITQFDTLLFRTRQDEIEKRLKALEEIKGK